MADADDFDVEELRRLLRGEGGVQPAKAPRAGAGTPPPRRAPAKAVKGAKGAKPAAKSKARKGPKTR